MSPLRNPREAAERIRHDLGRYVSLQQRFLPDDPTEADLREALLADLASTRRGPAGVADIGQVWAALAAERSALAGDPTLARLDDLVARLAASAGAIATAPRAELDRLAGLAREVTALARALGRSPG